LITEKWVAYIARGFVEFKAGTEEFKGKEVQGKRAEEEQN